MRIHIRENLSFRLIRQGFFLYNCNNIFTKDNGLIQNMKVHTEINDITTNVIKVFLNDSHFKGHVILLNAVNVIQIFVITIL